METEEGNLFFCVDFIRLLPEVPELWTLQSGIKAAQWYYRQMDRSGVCQGYVFWEKNKK